MDAVRCCTSYEESFAHRVDSSLYSCLATVIMASRHGKGDIGLGDDFDISDMIH